MPRIWLTYLDFLVDQRWVTKTRRAFDRALCALPITQHDRIWQIYLVSVNVLSDDVGVTVTMAWLMINL